MANRGKLSAADVTARIVSVPGWSVEKDKLHREYKFPDFAHAFSFMAMIATVAEKMDHHPEWLNVYNRITVDLSTHDAGGITELDFQLAAAMEKAASKLQ
jgi:4a-hydroxytetrahydrobiopterin dehydratase